MTAIRTAILGYGRSGSTMHAGGVEHNPAFAMAAVCDIDPARREEARARFGCPVYEDYRAMLAREALDLVIVVTRSDQHCRMACDCLDAGRHVLVTKPWAVNEEEARRMIAAAAHGGARLLPWLPARWGCDLRRLRQLVDEQAIGRVFMVRRAVSGFGTRCDWQTRREFGGGYLLNWGPHVVDPAVLLGKGRPVSVYGRMQQTINPGDAEDLFLALVNLDNGVTVQAEYTVAVEGPASWLVQGDRGTIVVQGRRLRVLRNTPAQPSDPTQYAKMVSQGQSTSEEELKGDVYGNTDEVYAEIAAALGGGHPFAVSTDDALGLTRLFDAIRLSAETDAVVRL